MAGFDNDVMVADNVDFSGGDPATGQITSDGQPLIGSSVSPNIQVGTLTGGSGIDITNANGSITVASNAAGPGSFPSFKLSISDAYNPLAVSALTSSLTVVNDRLMVFPISFTSEITLTTLGLRVIANAAGASGRLGLYSVDRSTGDFTLVADWGTFSLASTGFVTVSASPNTLDVDTMYCIAMVIDENGGATQILGQNTSEQPWYYDSSNNVFVRGHYIESVGIGALASSYQWSDFQVTTGIIPVVVYQ